MTDSLEFWFDFSSPYAYFAATDLDERMERIGRKVLWRPFLLGVAFQVTGMKPLGAMPLRGDYVTRDCYRIASVLQLPFMLREDFPYPSQAVARIFYWFDARDPALAKGFAKAAFAAYFGRGQDLRGGAEALALAEQFTSRGRDLSLWLESDDAKLALRKRTTEALDKGVFGSPFFLADGEPFWGWDRLPMVEAWLRRSEEERRKQSLSFAVRGSAS